MKLVQFHDAEGNIIAFNAELFCLASIYEAPEPPPGETNPDLHSVVACLNGYGFKVQESIDKVYEILKEVV